MFSPELPALVQQYPIAPLYEVRWEVLPLEFADLSSALAKHLEDTRLSDSDCIDRGGYYRR